MDMVSFRLKYIAWNVGLEKGKVLTFEAHGKDRVDIDISYIKDEKEYAGAKEGELLCVAQASLEPPRRVREWLNDISQACPRSFDEFSTQAFHILEHALEKLLKLLRWRIGHFEKRNPTRFLYSFEWAYNGKDWMLVQNIIQLKVIAGAVYQQISDEVVSSANKLWQSSTDEPLAHELLQEAWGNINNNPKSALVIGVAAAETGMKHLIAKLVPNSAWLIQNIPSPPLVKLLEEYLTELPTKVKTVNKALPKLPKSLLSSVTKAVLLRNEIVHGKNVNLDLDLAKEMLKTIRDVLYILDLYAGHIWAVDCISCETQSDWLKAKPN